MDRQAAGRPLSTWPSANSRLATPPWLVPGHITGLVDPTSKCPGRHEQVLEARTGRDVTYGDQVGGAADPRFGRLPGFPVLLDSSQSQAGRILERSGPGCVVGVLAFAATAIHVGDALRAPEVRRVVGSAFPFLSRKPRTGIRVLFQSSSTSQPYEAVAMRAAPPAPG